MSASFRASMAKAKNVLSKALSENPRGKRCSSVESGLNVYYLGLHVPAHHRNLLELAVAKIAKSSGYMATTYLKICAQREIQPDHASMPKSFTEPALVTRAHDHDSKNSRNRQSQSVHARSVHEIFAYSSSLLLRSKKKPEKAISKPVAQDRIQKLHIDKKLLSPFLSRSCLQKLQITLYQMEQNPPDIDTRLPYRIGCPQLPALPLETEEFQAKDINFPRWRAHEDGVLDILRNYKISGYAKPAYRFHRETPAEKHPTWLILSDIDKTGGINVWRQAARDIWNYLQQQGLNLSVEILDIQAHQGLETKPILSSEVELLKTWDNIIFRIATTVIQQGHDLKALDLVHQERRGLDASIAVIAITAKDADSNGRWYTTVEALYEFLPPSLRVEVRFGINVFVEGPSQPNSENIISLADYSATVDMGTSCGRSKFPFSGSLGGVIRLKGGRNDLALTNHHVMCGGDQPHQDLRQENGDSITPMDEIVKSKTIVAACPSDDDHEMFLKAMNSERNHLINEKSREVGIRGEGHQHIKELEHQIQFRTSRIQVAKDFDRRFGWVVASSGKRWASLPEMEHPNFAMRKSSEGSMVRWVLNWSLIQITNDRGFMDVVQQPGYASPIPARQYQSITPYKHYNVAKQGRSSGWTIGIISAAKCLLTAGNTPTNQPETCPAVLSWGEIPSLGVGYSVLPRDQKTPFLKPGDSGSFVLLDQCTDEEAKPAVSDNRKSIVGLGFGHNDAYNISYMTSMETVVEDIEKVTGEKVEQPSYAGDAPDTKEYLVKD